MTELLIKMTSEEAFVLALKEIPDEYFIKAVEYVLDGKKFIGERFSDGNGRGCINGTMFGHLDEVCGYDTMRHIRLILGYYPETLALFNNANYDKPILYQLILKEAERRGLLKKELEKIYRVQIEDLNDIETEVKVRCKPTKLSEAFRLTNKELKQIKGYVGDRSKKEACAYGALAYYFGDEKDDKNDFFKLGQTNPHIAKQTERFEEHIMRTYECGIVEMNNGQGWSFEDFAREAEKLGL